ncbi:hypothetical protein [Streptomyces sp. NPDC054883]
MAGERPRVGAAVPAAAIAASHGTTVSGSSANNAFAAAVGPSMRRPRGSAAGSPYAAAGTPICASVSAAGRSPGSRCPARHRRSGSAARG